MKQKMRLLIAENSEDFVWLLVQFFSKSSDIEIVGVSYDGNQALEMVRQTNPDILLLDIVMPGLDGIEVIRRLRLNNNHIKILVMSALETPFIKETVQGLGIEHYYVKPFDFCDLLSSMQSLQRENV